MAHDKGFVHRDIKPGNLLLAGREDDESCKLADFGLARASEASKMSGLTGTGQSGGTPAFMPPEQVLDFHSAKPPTGPPLPEALVAIIRRSLARKPEDRFVDVRAMQAALMACGVAKWAACSRASQDRARRGGQEGAGVGSTGQRLESEVLMAQSLPTSDADAIWLAVATIR